MAKVRKKATRPPRTKDWKNKPQPQAQPQQQLSLDQIIKNSETANLVAMKQVIDIELSTREDYKLDLT